MTTTTSALASARHGRPAGRGAILAFVAGMQMMRQAMGLPALARARPAVLEQIFARVLQALVDPANDTRAG